MARRIGFLAMQPSVKPERLAAGSGLEREEHPLDPPRREALDLEDVEAFGEPRAQERFRRSPVSAHFSCVALLDGGRVRHEGEETGCRLAEGLRRGLAQANHAAAALRFEMKEASAQAGPRPRSP